jgi:L-galactose dehydrogenase/L-glyceraldehyde 3-phosphate reductase
MAGNPILVEVSENQDLTAAAANQRPKFILRFADHLGQLRYAALYQVIDAYAFDSAQVVYNMLNPSAATALPANYPAQDYGRLFDRTVAAGVGVVGIRVLAGGALSGSTERHPIASPPPEPIGSAMSYDADILRSRRLMPLVNEGFASNLTEAASRFAISHPAIATILVGMATPQQFEDVLAAVQKGPLPTAALERLRTVRQAFAGKPR